LKQVFYRALAALMLLVSAQVHAQAAIVEGVQMPAWVERAGVRQPIVPGMVLQPGDVLHTGPESRLLVRMSERSVVKLGENGRLRFTEVSATKELFRAALGVFEGAFRFTTDLAAKNRRRDVSITAASVTIGIRGTDFWGRSANNNEIVCLIEGAIEVGAQGEAPVTMDQPRQFYRRVSGQTQPVGLVEPAQLETWARETDIQPGRGAARRGGRFEVQLVRAESQAAALALYDQLRTAGYPAEIRPVADGERRLYVVRIRNLASRADAQALEKQLRSRFSLAS
jgi:hypothetical protein